MKFIKFPSQGLTRVGGHEVCPVHHPGGGGDHGHEDRHHDQHGTLTDGAPGLGQAGVADEYVTLHRQGWKCKVVSVGGLNEDCRYKEI